jgi:hypothetical protein
MKITGLLAPAIVSLGLYVAGDKLNDDVVVPQEVHDVEALRAEYYELNNGRDVLQRAHDMYDSSATTPSLLNNDDFLSVQPQLEGVLEKLGQEIAFNDSLVDSLSGTQAYKEYNHDKKLYGKMQWIGGLFFLGYMTVLGGLAMHRIEGNSDTLFVSEY